MLNAYAQSKTASQNYLKSSVINRVSLYGRVNDNDVDEFIMQYDKRNTCDKPDYKTFIDAMLAYKKYFELIGEKESVRLIEAFIEDKVFYDNAKFVKDGSWLNNRVVPLIYIRNNGKDIVERLNVFNKGKQFYYDYTCTSTAKDILTNYGTICLQMFIGNGTSSEINKHIGDKISWHRNFRYHYK